MTERKHRLICTLMGALFAMATLAFITAMLNETPPWRIAATTANMLTSFALATAVAWGRSQ